MTLGNGPAGRPIKRSVSGRSRAEVERQIKELREVDASVAPMSGNDPTVAELLERWHDDVLSHEVSELTAKRYRSLAQRHITPVLGRKRLSKLSTSDVNHLMAQKHSEGLAASSIQRTLALLTKAIEQGVQWGMVKRNVAASARAFESCDDASVDAGKPASHTRKAKKTTSNTHPDGSADVMLAPISEALLGDRDVLSEEVMQSILENESAYTANFNKSDLQAAVWANMTEIYETLGGKPLDYACFDEIGQTRAEAEFPLHALLHAYRIGGKIEWNRFAQEAASAPHSDRLIVQGTTKFWDIWDIAVNRVTWAYESAVARRARNDVAARNGMIDLILNGGSVSGGLWDAAASLHLPLTGQFVAIAAETSGNQPILSRAASKFNAMNCTAVWRLHEELELGLISLTRSIDLKQVLQLVDVLAQGPTGVSDSFDDLRLAPRALRQARVACDASRGNPAGATTFSSVPLQALLVLTPSSAEELRRSILGPLLQISDSERRDLITTIRTLADAEGSVSECASRMFLHRNSIYHRLERISELTGRNPQTPIGMAELYTAIEADRLLSNHVRQGV